MNKLVQELRDLFSFQPCDSQSNVGGKRYKRLQRTLILRMAPIALLPLFILIAASYIWLQNQFEDELRHRLIWDMENTKNSIEYFVDVKLSALRFLAPGHGYEMLASQKILAQIFSEFKREFGSVVDLGMIDSKGIQHSYVGPYNLKGKDYSNQDWFHEVITRGLYVSDVFLGYRKLPHFAIAVKKDVPEQESFWILRATIDLETLNRFVSSIHLNPEDDAFIINQEGILQTPSRFYGNILENYPLPITHPKRGVSVLSIKDASGSPIIFGSAYINNSPWILTVILKAGTHAKIRAIFRGGFITILAVIISLVMLVAVRMVQVMVNWIKDCDQRREAALREAEHASKLASVGRLAAGVAHEINNPLAIINEKAGLIKDLLLMSDNTPNQKKFLDSVNGILESIKRSRTITQQLLGFARRMDYAPELLDLNDLIHEVLGFLEKETLFRDFNIEQNLKLDLPKIKSNRSQLQQVFLNILNNAMDAVDAGGTIRVSTDVKDANTVRVKIIDKGHGIPKDEVKHIFDPFFTTKEKDKGTGLGLFISYGIIKRLGGNILVETEINLGTTFTIELPMDTVIGRVC